MSSPSFTPLSPSIPQHPRAASTMPTPTLQTPNNTNTAAIQTVQQPANTPDDPTERSTGYVSRVMNDQWVEASRRSVLKEKLEALYPDALEYYEDRRTGKVEAEPFEARGEPVSQERAVQLWEIEHGKIQCTFFPMDYSHGFTGRGVLSRGDMERPGLVGPRNETVEEIAPPAGGLRFEQADRPRWQASDNKSGGPSEESRDDDEVGPFGESREDDNTDPQEERRDEEEEGPFGELMDDEEVGPFGESRSGDDGLRHDHEDGEQVEEVNNAEDVDELVQLAASTVSMMSEAPANAGTSSSRDTTSTFPTESQTSLTSSSLPLASTALTQSRKRGRDAEEDARDDESSSRQKRSRMDDVLGIVRRSPSQQKRRRMDGIFGIVRKNANEARAPQIVGAAMTSDIQQSKKRSRGPNDDSTDGTIQPTPKRQCLYRRSEETCGVEDQYLGDSHVDAATRDDSAFVHPPTSSNEVQCSATVAGTANTESLGQPTTEREPVINAEAEEREHATVEDEARPTQRGWNTAHGINSDSADVPVPRRGVHDITGQWSYLYLPTSRGVADRPWTEEEKEDLRAYIQDYGIGNWKALSQSMSRPEAELQYIYLEVAIARNKLAERPECEGIPRRYPKLTPPPRPRPPNRVEPPKLRSRSQIGRTKTHKLGDLKYDLKATSFPKVTRDGGMVDSKGNALLGIMGDLPRVNRRYPRSRQERPVNLLSSEVLKTVKNGRVGKTASRRGASRRA